MAKAKQAASAGGRKAWSFSHLLANGTLKAAEEEPKPAEEDDPTTEEDEDPVTAEDDADADPDAEGDDEAPDAEEEEEDVAASAAMKSALSAAERRGAAKERERCASIFGAPQAAGRVALAAQLAFGTDLQASAAIGVLGASPLEQTGGKLAQTMAQVKNPQLGTGGTGGSPSADQKAVDGLLAAHAAATGRGRKVVGKAR